MARRIQAASESPASDFSTARSTLRISFGEMRGQIFSVKEKGLEGIKGLGKWANVSVRQTSYHPL